MCIRDRHGDVVKGVMSFPEMDAMMYKIEGEDLYLIGTSEHLSLIHILDDTRWAAFTHDMEVKKAELHRLETTKVPLAELRTVDVYKRQGNARPNR